MSRPRPQADRDPAVRSTAEPALGESVRQPASPLGEALGLGACLVCAMLLVARPVAPQLSPYSAESAFAGLLALLFGLLSWGAWRLQPDRHTGSGLRRLGLPSLFFLGLATHGLLGAPHLGGALPRFGEYGLILLLLASAALLTSLRKAFPELLVRAAVAMGVTLSLCGIWQKYVELPRTRSQIAAGLLHLPDPLRSQQGLERLGSEEIFATFGNANSLGAFLLLTILLQAGLWLGAGRAPLPRSRRLASQAWHALALTLQLYCLYLSNSKGAWLALVAGLWFFLLLALRPGRPWVRWLGWATGAGLLLVIGILAAAAAGWFGEEPFGRSMQERFGYWQTAWEMIRRRPILGQGLAAFGECFPFFKVAGATEAREAHNDWLQLAAELGLCGPLAWGLLWLVVLRPAASAPTDRQPGHGTETFPPAKTPPRPGEEARAAREPKVRMSAQGPGSATAAPGAAAEGLPDPRLEWIWGGGALLVFLAWFVAFDDLNAPDLRAILDRLAGGTAESDLPSGAWAGACMALCTPLCFLSTLIGLRPAPGGAGRPEGPAPEPAVPLVWGCRAALGALLLHQLVDFDLTAQGVMLLAALLGGVLLALGGQAQAGGAPCGTNQKEAGAAEEGGGRAPGVIQPAPGPGGPLRGNAPQAGPAVDSGWRWALPVLAGLLLPVAVLIPLGSGLERSAAEWKEDSWRERSRSENPREAQGGTELLADWARHREAAWAWAPFDGQAAADLAAAYSMLRNAGVASWEGPAGGAGQTLDKRIEETWQRAARLRPRWQVVPGQQGCEAFQAGLRAQADGLRPAVVRSFQRAEEFFGQAARLYPLAPVFRIMRGDAFLFQGQVEVAGEAYLEAWRVDQRIVDGNTRLSAFFYDPRPGCLEWHGRTEEVLARVEEALRSSQWPGAFKGLLVRRMLALAALRLPDRSRPRSDSPAAQEALAGRFRQACKALTFTDPQDSHARFFHAAALAATLGGSNPEALRAWQAAQELWISDQANGRTATPSAVVRALASRLGLPR